MARRNSNKVRYDNLSQYQVRRLEKVKKYKDPRKDARSWTDKLFDKLTEAENDGATTSVSSVRGKEQE